PPVAATRPSMGARPRANRLPVHRATCFRRRTSPPARTHARCPRTWPPPAVGPPRSTHHQLVPRCRARTVHATSSARRYELGKTQRSATTARPTSATPGATRQLAPPREVTPPAPP